MTRLQTIADDRANMNDVLGKAPDYTEARRQLAGHSSFSQPEQIKVIDDLVTSVQQGKELRARDPGGLKISAAMNQ